MKKIILTFSILIGLVQFTKAQTQIGAGILIGAYNNTAVELKANFKATDNIDISPSLDYFLVSSDYDVTMFLISADGHYNFGDKESFQYYPIVGLNYFNISGSGYSYGSGIGLTVGGGGAYSISEKVKLYAEAKYIRDGFGLSAGILFSL